MSRIKKINSALELEAKALFASILLALLWANIDHHSYEVVVHEWNLHFVTNDILMCLFFLVVGIEIFFDFLPGGSFNPPQKAAIPLVGTAGGVVMPIAVFLVGATLLGTGYEGWAVGTATDIAVATVVIAMIVVKHHPAARFLKVLAVADDLIGIVLIAVFFTAWSVDDLAWGVLPIASFAVAHLMKSRTRIRAWWWYVPLMGISWWGLYNLHIHPALACLVPLFGMPHPDTDEDPDVNFELSRSADGTSTMSQFLRVSKYPLPVVLFLFGLANTGVVITERESWNAVALVVLAALCIGKPLGIVSFVMVGRLVFPSLRKADNLSFKELTIVGITAGIGLTVALFVSSVSYPAGSPELAGASIGALGSLILSGLVATSLATIWRVPREPRYDVLDEVGAFFDNEEIKEVLIRDN